MTEPKIVTVKDLVARHKMEARRLRVILRSTGMRAKDGRYEVYKGHRVMKSSAVACFLEAKQEGRERAGHEHLLAHRL